MLLIFLYITGVQALLLPEDVRVDNWHLTCTPTTKESDVTYSVQYSTRFRPNGVKPVWKNVTTCNLKSSNSCDVSFTKAQAEYNCVMLRVKAKRFGVTTHVNACHIHSNTAEDLPGDSCTPKVNLIARTRSLTVGLNKKHNLHQTHADNVEQRVFFGKEGEKLKKHGDYLASVTMDNLEEGQRYCVRVQYVYIKEPVGLSTCNMCEVIPQSTSKQAGIVVAVVVIVVLVVLTTLTAYVLIYKLEKIKQWLKPPCKMPDHLLHMEHVPIYTSSPSEEVCDSISRMISVD